MIAARVGQLSDYILLAERDLDAGEQTPFQLRSLSAAARAKVQDSMVGFNEEHEATLQCPGTGMLIACKYGIAGWKNMKDDDGKDVEIKWTRTPDGPVLLRASLDVLADQIMELGGAVVTLNKMDTDEETEKTSGNVPDSPSSPTSPPSERSTEATTSPTTQNAQTATAADPGQAKPSVPVAAAVEP